MKIIELHDILKRGHFSESSTWKRAWSQVKTAIRITDWPHGTGKFLIYPESGKGRRQGNGVVPIKLPCIRKLEEYGWEIEDLPKVEKGVLSTGDLDALKYTRKGLIGFEWETGNISSSHRALNKLLLTLKMGGIKAGILVVPSNNLKKYLTDRIGNIGELQPYFPLWNSIRIRDGILRIVVVEYDETSVDVPRIPKGFDGRALE